MIIDKATLDLSVHDFRKPKLSVTEQIESSVSATP